MVIGKLTANRVTLELIVLIGIFLKVEEGPFENFIRITGVNKALPRKIRTYGCPNYKL